MKTSFVFLGRSFFIFLNCAAFCSIGFAPAFAFADEPKWGAHVEAEGKWGTERSLGEIGLFAPLAQDEDTLLFTNIIGRLDNHDGSEGNFGLGVRHMLPDSNWIVGGYGFYDRRRTGHDNLFHQATLGVEAMSERYELRVNAYIPEADEKFIGSGGFTPSINGGQFQISHFNGPVERALPGFDVEAGMNFEIAKDWKFWAYAGAFHFDADEYENVTGPRGRIEISRDNLPYLGEGSRLTLGVEAQTDKVRDEQMFAVARLRVPFLSFSRKSERRSLSPLEKRMTDRITRDVDVVGAERGPQLAMVEPATVTINGQAYGGMTEVDAADNVSAAVTAAGANSLIVVNGAGGTVNTNTITLNAGQALVGGGAVLNATGSNTGAVNPLVMPGTRPTLRRNAGVVIVDLADNASVVGMDFDGNSNAAGIRGNSTDNILVENVSINNVSGGMVLFNGSGAIRSLQVAQTGPSGVFLNASTVTIDGLSAGNNTNTGLDILNNSVVTLNNAQIGGFLQNGLYIESSSLTMNNTLFSDITNGGSVGIFAFFATFTNPGTGNRMTNVSQTCADFFSTGQIAFEDINGTGPGTCP